MYEVISGHKYCFKTVRVRIKVFAIKASNRHNTERGNTCDGQPFPTNRTAPYCDSSPAITFTSCKLHSVSQV